MRRSILLALIAALALTLGLGNVATAGQGAATSAKSGKKGKRGKGKACKGKQGKGKSRGKARRSADASAKARKGRKGKGRSRGCKGGGANWLEIGKYRGEGVIEVEIRSRKRFRVRLPEAPATCIPGLPVEVETEDAKLTASKLTAGYTAEPGQRGFIRGWTLTVYPNYKYKLVVSTDTTDIGIPCSKPGAKFEGKLKKIG